MFAAVPNNDNANSNNFFFNYQKQESLKLLRKGFERSVSWNEYKTKSKIKNRTNEYIFLGSIDYLFCFIQIKMAMLKDLKSKDIT